MLYTIHSYALRFSFYVLCVSGSMLPSYHAGSFCVPHTSFHPQRISLKCTGTNYYPFSAPTVPVLTYLGFIPLLQRRSRGKQESRTPNACHVGQKTSFDTNSITTFNQCGSTSCLLYTSPSPRDQRGSRMPSSA